MMNKRILHWSTLLGKYVCRHRGSPFADAIADSVSVFLKNANNVNFKMEENGELRVAKALKALEPKIVLDVGANWGEWSRMIAGLYPDCQIHAFEPVPSTFELLSRTAAGLNNMMINPFGLSDCNERVQIYFSSTDSSTATSCKIHGMKMHDDYYKQATECEFRKGANYVREKNIAAIDFLKVDVEGMELKVIKGFEESISLVRAIQFEYGIFNIGSHDLLADLCAFLSARDFAIGKIYPNRVTFFEYHFNHENFHGSNYIAVSGKEKGLIEILGKA